MMWWNGSWAWAWLVMLPMMVAMWALVVWAVSHWPRAGAGSVTALDRLDARFAAGDIGVDEYRERRTELERR